MIKPTSDEESDRWRFEMSAIARALMYFSATGVLAPILRAIYLEGLDLGERWMRVTNKRVRNTDVTLRIPHAVEQVIEAADARARILVDDEQVRSLSIRRAASWVAIDSQTSAVIQNAISRGVYVLWVAERNACLHCLAYQGRVVKGGDSFPAGLSFDPHGGIDPFGKLLGPPLHPHCRCNLRIWFDDQNEENLMREARRTVVLGWSDYAGLVRRAQAADLLLARGAALPKTVEERGERFVNDVRKKRS